MGAWNLFSPREKFLVVEIGTAGSGGFLLELSRDKVLKLRRTWCNFDLQKLIAGSRSFGRNTRIVFSLDFPLAFEAAAEVAARRENPDTPLKESELENILVEALQKNFNFYRQAAAKSLGLPELGAVLIAVRIRDLKFDRSAVCGGCGQKPKQVSAVLETVFTARDTLHAIRDFWRHLPEAFFTESVTAQMFALRKIRGLEKINFLAPAGFGHCLFTPWTDGGWEGLRRHVIRWPADWPHRVLSSIWGLEAPAAAAVYREYAAGNISVSMRKHLDGVFRPLTRSFGLRLKSKLPRGNNFSPGIFAGGGVCAATTPQFLNKNLRLDNSRDILPFLLQKTGFVLGRRWPLDESATLRILGPILQACQEDNPDLSQRVWRRLHWLNLQNMR